MPHIAGDRGGSDKTNQMEVGMAIAQVLALLRKGLAGVEIRN